MPNKYPWMVPAYFAHSYDCSWLVTSGCCAIAVLALAALLLFALSQPDTDLLMPVAASACCHEPSASSERPMLQGGMTWSSVQPAPSSGGAAVEASESEPGSLSYP